MTTSTASANQSTDKPLTGRVAAITGASSGIGAATAKALAADGASVALLARRKERLDEIVAEIAGAGGEATAIELDVTSEKNIAEAAAQVRQTYGPTSILFNNAGVMLPAPIEELAAEQWHHQIDLNITGLVDTIGAFVPQLVEAAEAGGVADLINTSSIAAKNIFPNFAVYSASKAFVTQLSRHLRVELGPKNVRVGALEPGVVSTELQSHVTDSGAQEWLEGAAESIELLQPEDIAEIVTFLTSRPRHVNLQQVTVMPTGQEM